jgi:uncharacterized protein YjaG (DUF416 family)
MKEARELQTQIEQLERHIAQQDKRVQDAVLTEREACAALCDLMAKHPEYAESATTKLAAYAIRSRNGTITLAELRKTDLYRSIQTQSFREVFK